MSVTLTNSNSSVLSIPNSQASFPSFSSVADVTVSGLAAGATTLRATAPGYADGTLTVNVTLNLISTPTL